MPTIEIKPVKLLGPEPPSWFDDDGCTWAPDKWKSLDWHLACRWHDFAYSTMGNVSRIMADCYLMINMIKLGAPWRVALMYFLAVRWFGKKHYRK